MRDSDRERRALVIGVSRFGAPVPGEELDLGAFGDLEAARPAAEGIVSCLAGAGYETCGPLLDPDADVLGHSVMDLIEHALREDVLVVHVVSHGQEADRSSDVYVIGADGRRHHSTGVEGWLKRVEDYPEAPTTLFVLDICRSGRAVQLPWQIKDRDATAMPRAWVIAAAASRADAFDCRLSWVFAQMVDELSGDNAQGRLGLDPSVAFVPWLKISGYLRDGVNRLSDGGYGQDVTVTFVDREWEVPFFPNPHYRPPTVVQMAQQEAPPTAAAFVDVFVEASVGGVDVEHFADRAAGRQRGSLRRGLFRGRSDQLAWLSDWLTRDDPGDRLRIVTGGPGSGKSALLGVMVCAGLPGLRDLTRPLWEHLPDTPPAIGSLVALHARQRDAAELTDAVATQLGLEEPDEGWSPDGLAGAVSACNTVPTIIVDALDEATQPGAVTSVLLLPLLHARRPDGSAACRLLVGTRSGALWPAVAPLVRASREGQILDLDAVDRGALRDDLRHYLADLLITDPVWASAGPGVVAVADTVASRLVDRVQDGRVRWGEFLVAGLYANHLLDVPPPSTLSEWDSLLAQVPTTLPAVVELDLAQDGNDDRRILLRALSTAKGEGMPARVLVVVAAALDPRQDESRLTPGRVHDALRRLGFYLRTGVDVDGTTLYRLFHQGLADYLSAGLTGLDYSRILDVLLADREDATGRRRWSAADPYLLRAALDHATDAGRLDELLTDTEFLVAAPPTVTSRHAVGDDEVTALTAVVYMSSLASLSTTRAWQRRDILACNAARHGARCLAQRIADGPDSDSTWSPRWATGGGVNPALRAIFTNLAGPVNSVACTVLDGRPVAVTGGNDGTVRIWDLAAHSQIGDPMIGHTDHVRAVACAVLDGGPVAVTGGNDGTVRIWDLAAHSQIGAPMTGSASAVGAVACTVLDGHPVAVTGGNERMVRIWDLATHNQTGQLVGNADAVACTVLDGRPVAVTVGDEHTVRIWDLARRAEFGRPLSGHTDDVWAVACTVLDGRPVAVTAGGPLTAITGGDLTVRIWDLADRAEIGQPLTGHTAPVWAVACAVLDGRPVAVTAGWDGTIRVWNLATETQIGEPFTGHTDRIGAVACTVVDGRPVAVTGSDDRTVRVWDLAAGSQIGDRLAGHTTPILAIAITVLGGHAVAVTAGSDGSIRVWDVAAGTQIGQPLAVHSGWNALGCTVVAGRAVMVTAGSHETVRVWDLASHTQICDPVTEHAEGILAVACTQLDGRPVAVTVSNDESMWVWDLADGPQIGERLAVHTGSASSVACTVVDGRPVAVTAGSDRMVRVWDLTAGPQIGHALTGHTDRVRAVACTVVDGRPVAVTGSDDKTVRVWDLRGGLQIGRPIALPDRVSGLACGPAGELALTFGFDVAVYARLAQR